MSSLWRSVTKICCMLPAERRKMFGQGPFNLATLVKFYAQLFGGEVEKSYKLASQVILVELDMLPASYTEWLHLKRDCHWGICLSDLGLIKGGALPPWANRDPASEGCDAGVLGWVTVRKFAQSSDDWQTHHTGLQSFSAVVKYVFVFILRQSSASSSYVFTPAYKLVLAAVKW